MTLKIMAYNWINNKRVIQIEFGRLEVLLEIIMTPQISWLYITV